MRKSLPKMPRSAPSSRVAVPPAGFRPAAAARRARAEHNGQRPHRTSLAGEDDGRLRARLELLEGFVSLTDLADCAHHALDWLATVLHVRQSMCLIRAYGEEALYAVAWSGLPASTAGAFVVNLDDWSDPIVNVLHSHQRRHFAEAHTATERRRRPDTPLAGAAFHVVPIAFDNL